jgi:hypothetical protein
LKQIVAFQPFSWHGLCFHFAGVGNGAEEKRKLHPISGRVLGGWDQSRETEMERRSSPRSLKALAIATAVAATPVSPAADAAVAVADLAPDSTPATKMLVISWL